MNYTFPIGVESFLSMIEERPHLWDKSLGKYKNRDGTRRSWYEILENMYPDCTTWNPRKQEKYVNKLQKKWTYIRDSYIRSEKKIEMQKKFGRHARFTKPYLYHENLKFLKKNELFPKYSNTADSLNEVYLTVKNGDSSDEDGSHHSADSFDRGVQFKFEDVSQEVEIEQPKSRSNVLPVIKSTSIRQSASVPTTDSSMVQLMAFPSQADKVNRHISFFNGLIPTLDQFDDDQVIEFQLGVLQLMKQVKNKSI